MNLGLAAAAAVAYCIGGVFMKLSEGLVRGRWALLLYLCFAAGASLQAIGMRRGELGVTYIAVLGLEAIFAYVLGVLVFGERVTATRLTAVLLMLVGLGLLRR